MKTSKKLLSALILTENLKHNLVKNTGSLSAINKWVKRYSEIKTEDGDIFTAAHIKELQKRLPYSRHTQARIRRSS